MALACPTYAILSHTWGDNEVTFEDIEEERPSVRRKKGYAKIWYCCRQARADGHQWVWVDTCCINRKFGTELSEAIISMYAWHRDSRVCYVFLEMCLRRMTTGGRWLNKPAGSNGVGVCRNL